jgi:hypothetical protein
MAEPFDYAAPPLIAGTAAISMRSTPGLPPGFPAGTLWKATQFRLNSFCCPSDTQSMQDELISKTQLTGV